MFLASVIRSGTSMTRKLIESISGIWTGTDLPILNPSPFSLAVQGLRGGNHHDGKVWFIKTHFPAVFPNPSLASASKAILIVRNPLDIIVSSFMLITTLTHSKTC